ncbi:uncharacterized protein LOC121521166 [Cheilinus undulatus]|uniref:uncharacterized protein LOC121521166 n=1 Tax=Cheilinus undulatus TaxID=241271 RepID=UPI001BD3CF90|nr:uncharacterized protein LOC121521166 [Cheilinus undulatus]
MEGNKWIYIFGFLTVLLQFAARADGIKDLYITARVGDDATLTCENVLRDQPNCSSTTWTDSFKNPAEELVKHGQIKRPGSKSDRLAVREDCSLVIKKVTHEDVGRYSCQQYTSGGKHGDDAQVDLSVLTMTEISKKPKQLRCHVISNQCIHKVKWLYKHTDVKQMTTQTHCFTDLTLEPHHNIDSLQCEVTGDNNRQLFPFRPPSSGDKPDNGNGNTKSTAKKGRTAKPTEKNATPGTKTTPASGNDESSTTGHGNGSKKSTTQTSTTQSTEKNTTPGTTTTPASGNEKSSTTGDALPLWLWLVIILAGVALITLLIVVVKTIRWKRTEGNRAEMTDNAADPEDGITYASISYTRKKKNKNEAQGKDDDDDGTVTYATVKMTPSSSAGVTASADPSTVYTTVNRSQS